MGIAINAGVFAAGTLVIFVYRLLLRWSWPLLVRLKQRAMLSITVILACVVASFAVSIFAGMILDRFGQFQYPTTELSWVAGVIVPVWFERRSRYSKPV